MRIHVSIIEMSQVFIITTISSSFITKQSSLTVSLPCLCCRVWKDPWLFWCMLRVHSLRLMIVLPPGWWYWWWSSIISLHVGLFSGQPQLSLVTFLYLWQSYFKCSFHGVQFFLIISSFLALWWMTLCNYILVVNLNASIYYKHIRYHLVWVIFPLPVLTFLVLVERLVHAVYWPPVGHCL